MKKIILRLFLSYFFSVNSIASAHPSEYLIGNLHEYPVGMFSVFSYVVGLLYKYDSGSYAGIEINFEKSGLYYDPLYGENWWEYYCEPIVLGKNKGIVKKSNLYQYINFCTLTELILTRKQVNALIQEYIKIKPHIQTKVDKFFEDNLEDHYVISVHYRGTDKALEAPRVAYEKVIETVKNHIKENNLNEYRIFVATDEWKFIETMENEFSDSICFYDSHRSHDGKPVHISTPNNYEIGEEALIDCLLLSKGNILIRTSSCLSMWSTFFNSDIPVILLSHRHGHNKT